MQRPRWERTAFRMDARTDFVEREDLGGVEDDKLLAEHHRRPHCVRGGRRLCGQLPGAGGPVSRVDTRAALRCNGERTRVLCDANHDSNAGPQTLRHEAGTQTLDHEVASAKKGAAERVRSLPARDEHGVEAGCGRLARAVSLPQRAQRGQLGVSRAAEALSSAGSTANPPSKPTGHGHQTERGEGGRQTSVSLCGFPSATLHSSKCPNPSQKCIALLAYLVK